jgi:DNA polymerase IIIc chi subunit
MSFAVVRAKPIAASTAILIEALSLNALSEKIVVLIELRKTIAKQEKTMMVELTLFVNMLETSDDSTERYEIFMSLK